MSAGAKGMGDETRGEDGGGGAPHVCRHLRTKTAFGTFRGNLYRWQTGRSTTAVYWCLRTMETAGPDDLLTHPHACREGRACFERNEVDSQQPTAGS